MPRRRLEKRTKRLIQRFYKHLTMKKGLSDETASKHAQRIEFFALHYLRDYEGKSLLDASGNDIENYLGDWYIQRVLNSSKSDVRPALVAFKKFFKFLYETRKIDKEQLQDIVSACESPQRYIRRFETYFELEPWTPTWDEDFEDWLLGYGDEGEEDHERPFEVNEELSRAFSEEDLEANNTTVLDDFLLFLSYIVANNGMKLTAAHSFFARKHLLTLNQLMSYPEELKSTANQPDSRTIHLFYNLGKTLGLFTVSAKNTLELTPRMDIFTILLLKEQFVVLFDAMWNETSWEKFLAPYSGGRPEWAQARRGDVALLFSRCEPGKTYLFKEQLKQLGMELADTEDEFEGYSIMAEFALSVFAERIMPALRLFGLLDFGYAEDRDEYFVRHGLGIAWFSVSELGKKIFEVLVQEGQ